MLFPPFEFPFHGPAHKVRPVLTVLQDGVYPVERPLGEPGLHVLGPHLFSAHDDYFSYEVLTMTDKSYEIRKSQSRETAMTLQVLETLARKNGSASMTIVGIEFEITRKGKPGSWRCSYRYGGRHMGKDEAEMLFAISVS